MGDPTPAVTTPSAVPVFFLSDSTGISAETMGNALLIQFPDAAVRASADPVHHHRRGGAQGRRRPRRGHGRAGHPAGLLHHRGHRDPRRAAPVTLPADRLLRPAHDPGRVDPRPAGSAGRRPAARGRRRPALQRPDGRRRVRHRARRRAEHAGPGQGRRDLGRPVPVRQDAHHDVPGAAARHLRRQLPAGGGGLRHQRAAQADPAPARPLLRHHHDRGPTQSRCATSGGRTPATPRWSSARTSCVGPRRSTGSTRSRRSTPRPSPSRRCPP